MTVSAGAARLLIFQIDVGELFCESLLMLRVPRGGLGTMGTVLFEDQEHQILQQGLPNRRPGRKGLHGAQDRGPD